MSVTWLPGLPGWLMDGTSVLLVLDWCSPYRYLAGGAGGTALAAMKRDSEAWHHAKQLQMGGNGV